MLLLILFDDCFFLDDDGLLEGEFLFGVGFAFFEDDCFVVMWL